ncbi:hypothetical protein [Cytobacillus firmus]|jgi:hypothetical protein|uniref:CDP-glycerol:poly(Glycerophosphate) glycerophosphotransferase n=1 Tax=Cytobacillus firmus TaxID=1399 RepID=A0AA46SJQ9_CYTFI|nr:hypothetical protein [Cytobacillus firmus]KML36111.1 hypothetical protein VL14_21865 [Cytobacillus firmus]MCS0652935.1 hypothetical protein [Cytobacillus firmus]MCU1803807.1 hypothetical protein [Cytobacillus firmus]UYG95810.1 hypothetical protein OD459_01930 [Cytobacillus firmus]WHY36511.1 hypothetical protein QNH44_12350 [Cytobacillus firmus]
MKDYLNNFYSFHLDFIHQFKSVEYKGIPLPLLFRIENFLTRCNLIQELYDPQFNNHLTVKINDKSEVQKRYDVILNNIDNHQNNKANVKNNAKLLLFDFVLHASSFVKRLDSKRIIVINQNNWNEKLGLSEFNNKPLKERLTFKAKEIFNGFDSHPIYSNKAFQQMVLNFIPNLVDNLATIDRFFSRMPISCVLTGTTTDTMSRVLTLVAKLYGIPSLCLQHGLFGIEEQYMPVLATKNCVLGEYEKDWYLARGAGPGRIEITGHPRHDRIFARNVQGESRLRQSLRLDPRKKTMLILTQPSTQVEPLNKFISYISQRTSFQIFIKAHPHEYANKTLHKYNSLFNNSKSLNLIPQGTNLYHLIPSMDLIIVASDSTAGLEAMLFEKAAVLFLKNQQDRPFDFYDDMGKFISSDPYAVAALAIQLEKDRCVQKIEYENKRYEFISKRYPRKQSGQEIIKLINILTGTNYTNGFHT